MRVLEKNSKYNILIFPMKLVLTDPSTVKWHISHKFLPMILAKKKKRVGEGSEG